MVVSSFCVFVARRLAIRKGVQFVSPVKDVDKERVERPDPDQQPPTPCTEKRETVHRPLRAVGKRGRKRKRRKGEKIARKSTNSRSRCVFCSAGVIGTS